MGIFDQIKKFKEMLFATRAKPQLEQKNEEIKKLDTRRILKDSKREDLVCFLCENWDNESGDYYPIHEGEKKVYMGKPWHLGCFRAFMKASRRGGLL